MTWKKDKYSEREIVMRSIQEKIKDGSFGLTPPPPL
jgi:hypothetical protein